MMRVTIVTLIKRLFLNRIKLVLHVIVNKEYSCKMISQDFHLTKTFASYLLNIIQSQCTSFIQELSIFQTPPFYRYSYVSVYSPQVAGFIIIICRQLGKIRQMNTKSAQNCFTPYFPRYHQSTTFSYSHEVSTSLITYFKQIDHSEKGHNSIYKPFEEMESPSFETRYQRSIIICSNTDFSHTEPIPSPTDRQTKKAKLVQKKIIQKQSRNVTSNLLRIFLKHVIELRFYDEVIQKMIECRSLKCTMSEFHSWLISFGINYKNYIRLTQVKRILRDHKCEPMRTIFKMLVHLFSKGVGAEHCLTSRRIEKSAVLMHLKGLRELLQQVVAK